ncbi:HD domain-containing protein [Paractinoplanes atraurantiacus]|uniref:GTP pyrophosphokinase n=1 Tax=Paractinoplanes atraurantiacus TaxID=1036182 RepID=A0A285I7U7_9ACTN|nr:HD domain-containing protein [Actinoplanes atraurantiacus]SNY43963.1 GTP pyrophosphokinase [Actinoplanes atraurantiacus]
MSGLARMLSDSDRNRDIPLVWNAYEVAEVAHRGQRRTNGDRYITHPVEVATIVAAQGGSVHAVCAALLHDVIEDAAVASGRLHAEFGSEIATLVDDLTSRAIRVGGAEERDLALVTIADRLHNLRTLRRVSAQGRQRTSLDALVFHVPLARQVDAPVLAAEMTDLACAALASLDRRRVREGLSRAAGGMRSWDSRGALEAAAALGGGAAVIGADVVPEWALAAGGAGLLALVAAALFGRDARAAQRLADLIEAWRRR